MPRSKPKETIVHRIELGSWERQRVEGIAEAYSFNKVASPIIAALSDVSFVLLVGSMLAAWKFIDEDTWKAMSRGVDTAEGALAALIEAAEKAVADAQQLREELGDIKDDPFGYFRTLVFGPRTSREFEPDWLTQERIDALTAMYSNQPTGTTPTSPADVWGNR